MFATEIEIVAMEQKQMEQKSSGLSKLSVVIIAVSWSLGSLAIMWLLLQP